MILILKRFKSEVDVVRSRMPKMGKRSVSKEVCMDVAVAHVLVASQGTKRTLERGVLETWSRAGRLLGSKGEKKKTIASDLQQVHKA